MPDAKTSSCFSDKPYDPCKKHLFSEVRFAVEQIAQRGICEPSNNAPFLSKACFLPICRPQSQATKVKRAYHAIELQQEMNGIGVKATFLYLSLFNSWLYQSQATPITNSQHPQNASSVEISGTSGVTEPFNSTLVGDALPLPSEILFRTFDRVDIELGIQDAHILIIGALYESSLSIAQAPDPFTSVIQLPGTHDTWIRTWPFSHGTTIAHRIWTLDSLIMM